MFNKKFIVACIGDIEMKILLVCVIYMAFFFCTTDSLLQETLCLDRDEDEALKHFKTSFNNALKNSWATSLNWAAHNIARNNKWVCKCIEATSKPGHNEVILDGCWIPRYIVLYNKMWTNASCCLSYIFFFVNATNFVIIHSTSRGRG